MYTYTDFLLRVRGQFIFVKTYYPSISQYEILTYFNIYHRIATEIISVLKKKISISWEPKSLTNRF